MINSLFNRSTVVRRLRVVCLLLIVISVALPVVAAAQDEAGKGFLDFLYFSGYKQTYDYSTSAQDLTVSYIVSIIQAFLGLLGVIFFLVILYGGWLWMMAGGNEEQLTQAKHLLRDAIIGLAIVFAAYAIAYVVIYVASAGLYDSGVRSGF
ncbi:hypothetical protein HY933_04330 [Candidatus Falkowbacteria bacterium]|nr:hypothetical protein [Candidatus Falkowbacteria bacterium]